MDREIIICQKNTHYLSSLINQQKIKLRKKIFLITIFLIFFFFVLFSQRNYLKKTFENERRNFEKVKNLFFSSETKSNSSIEIFIGISKGEKTKSFWKNLFSFNFQFILSEIKKKFFQFFFFDSNKNPKNFLKNIQKMIFWECSDNFLSKEIEEFFIFFINKKQSEAKIKFGKLLYDNEKFSRKFQKKNKFCFFEEVDEMGFVGDFLPKCFSIRNISINFFSSQDTKEKNHSNFNFELKIYFFGKKEKEIMLQKISKVNLIEENLGISQEKNFSSDGFFLFYSEEEKRNLKVCELNNLRNKTFEGIWIEFNFNREINYPKDFEFCFDNIIFYK